MKERSKAKLNALAESMSKDLIEEIAQKAYDTGYEDGFEDLRQEINVATDLWYVRPRSVRPVHKKEFKSVLEEMEKTVEEKLEDRFLDLDYRLQILESRQR